MIAVNPQLKEVIPLLEKNNGDYCAAFYDLANQKGIDAESFLNSLK